MWLFNTAYEFPGVVLTHYLPPGACALSSQSSHSSRVQKAGLRVSADGFLPGAWRDNGFQASLQLVVVPAGLAETCQHYLGVSWLVGMSPSSWPLSSQGLPSVSVFPFSLLGRTLVGGLRAHYPTPGRPRLNCSYLPSSCFPLKSHPKV